MPVFEVRAPNGKTYEVNGPPGSTKEQALAQVQKSLGAQPEQEFPEGDSRNEPAAVTVGAPQSGPVGDVVKSAAAGALKGAAGLVGALGDASGDGFPLGVPSPSNPVAMLAAVKSKPIIDTIGSFFGGVHEPETRAGKYAETIASFAPAAGAPGSMAARLARVAVPGAMSEGAGQLTEGTAAEPYARMIGALAGGVATGVGEAAALARKPTPGVQSVAELKRSATNAYQTADDAGLIIGKDSFKAMTDGLSAKLAEEGIDATLHPRAMAALNRLRATDDNITLKGVDILRRVAGSAAGSVDRDERRIGRIIKDQIDDYIGNLEAGDVIQGDAEGASAALTSARDLWSRASKGEIIENAMTKAKTRAGQFSVSGEENGIRTEFRKIAMSDRAMRRFNAEEQAAIRQVAEGTTAGNALRMLGKLAIRGPVSSLPAMAGYSLLGPAGAAGAAAIGEVGRFGSAASTARNARYASELVRSPPASLSSISRGAAVRPALEDQSAIPYAALIATLAGQQALGQ